MAVTDTSQPTEEDLVNKAEALQMEKILRQNAFGVAVIQGNDKATQFYTVLHWVNQVWSLPPSLYVSGTICPTRLLTQFG